MFSPFKKYLLCHFIVAETNRLILSMSKIKHDFRLKNDGSTLLLFFDENRYYNYLFYCSEVYKML